MSTKIIHYLHQMILLNHPIAWRCFRKINATMHRNCIRRTYPLAFSPKASNILLQAGLLTYSIVFTFPIQSVAKSNTMFLGAYSSGNCSGLTPNSLLIISNAWNKPLTIVKVTIKISGCKRPARDYFEWPIVLNKKGTPWFFKEYLLIKLTHISFIYFSIAQL